MTDTSRHAVATPRNQDGRRLVIVSGAGRSGTSTAAGSLKYLGYVVPPPELPANAANPRGYFEPRWAINFHKRLLGKASIHTMDTRPWAPELITKATKGGGFQRQLTAWLEQSFDHGDQLVVKDPRAFWARSLWLEAAKAAGAQTSFLTMLRHPAEVIGSRDTHYSSHQSQEQRAAGLVKNLAGWINTTLLNEQYSRGHRRAFLRYGDLLEDWRSAMSRVNATLDLGIDPLQFDHDVPHEIDDFIDPGLHRVRVTWDDFRIPPQLQEMADLVWATLTQDAVNGIDVPPQILKILDTVRADYRQQFSDAVALAGDEINSRARQARNQARREAQAEAERAAGARDRDATRSGGPSATGGTSTPARKPAVMPSQQACSPLAERLAPLRRATGRVVREWRKGRSGR